MLKNMCEAYLALSKIVLMMSDIGYFDVVSMLVFNVIPW